MSAPRSAGTRPRAAVVGFYNMRRREMLAASPTRDTGPSRSWVRVRRGGHHAERGQPPRTGRLVARHAPPRRTGPGCAPSAIPTSSCRSRGWEQPLDATRPTAPRCGPTSSSSASRFPCSTRRCASPQRPISSSWSARRSVYPAAALVRYVRPDIPIYLIDPGEPDTSAIRNANTHIRERAAVGMPSLAAMLLERSSG